MKKIILLAISFLVLISCSSDDGPTEQPIEPVLPVANFSASETAIETGAKVTFSESSEDANSYSWTFEGGDPTTSTDKNPEITYAASGTYDVSLKVSNADGDDTETKADYITVTDVVTVTPPTAEFSASITTVEAGMPVVFTDASTDNPTSWDWEFEGGDPATSTDQNPTVTYATVGTYAVSLTATNTEGEDVEAKTAYITVTEPAIEPEAEFIASATTISGGQQITFTDSSTNNPSSWSWEFEGGDPATSTEQNPIVNYPNSGSYGVILTATNDAGSTTEVKSAYITVEQQTASYTVTFTSNWNSTNHPTDFPSATDHFSPATGMVHKPGTTFFKNGELASPGVEIMAESGGVGTLNDEINVIVNAGDAMSRINGGGIPHGSVETTFTIEVTEEFSLVTLVSMIAPSPDWFVAVEDVNLFNGSEFIQNTTIAAISYDAGTDDGSTYSSSNSDTNENIFLITDAPLGNGSTVDPPAAFFTFERN